MSSKTKIAKDIKKVEKLTYDISREANNLEIAQEALTLANKYIYICNRQRGELNRLNDCVGFLNSNVKEVSMLLEDVKGVIVIGYTGIGKTTQAKEDNLFVDLESSCFKLAGDDRFDRWYMVYCAQAINIAEQGRIVLVSSHEEVRQYLTNIPMPEGVVVLACYPNMNLKYEWIDRLHDRYKNDSTEKNFRAYANVEDNFDSNIEDMMNCKCPKVVINQMGYSLKKLIVDKIKEL